MNQTTKTEFTMPGGSWDTIKRIIQAYYATHEVKESTVASIANLGGMARPIISRNNNFLRSVGLVEENQFRLTQIGVRLAVGLAKKDQSLIVESLQEVINKTEKLNQIVRTVQARGEITERSLRNEALLALGLNEKSAGIGYLRTVLELLYESRMLTVENGKVSFFGEYVREIKGIADDRQENERRGGRERPGNRGGQPNVEGKVPIPLGAERRAYLELPSDWQPKDLKKLLKMIELALGEDETSEQ